jgi:hypothetical protein
MSAIQDTTELQEIVNFAYDLAERISNATADDGKIGALEGLQLVFALIPKARAAFSGIANVKAELADLTGSEVQNIADSLFQKVTVEDGYKLEITRSAIKIAAAIADAVQVHRNRVNYRNPPVANPIAE